MKLSSDWKVIEALWEEASATDDHVDVFLANRPEIPEEISRQFRLLWLASKNSETEKWTGSALVSGGQSEINPAEELLGQTLCGYTIEKHIGSGASSDVFFAVKTVDNLTHGAAIKVLTDASWRTRSPSSDFHREFQALARLNHPFITHFLDSGTTEAGWPFVITEFVQGKTITDFSDELTNAADVISVFQQTCHAVDYAHRNLIVHCDLKPSNILVVNETRTPKVLDFGLARRLTDDGRFEADPKLVAFSRDYASPEQIEQHTTLTTAVDIYSLGILLVRLLSGKKPYHLTGQSLPELVSELNRIDVASAISLRDGLTGLSRSQLDDVVFIVRRATATLPAERYGSAASLAEDLQRVLENRPVAAADVTPGYLVRRYLKRHRLAAIALALVFSIVLASGISISMAFLEAEKQREIAARELRRIESINSFIKTMLSSANPGVTGKDTRVVDVLQPALHGLRNGAAQDPATRADLALVIGEVYDALSEYSLADEAFELAIELRSSVYPEHSPEVLEARALRLRDGGMADTTEQIINELEDIVDKLTESAGQTDPRTLTAQAALAERYYSSARLEDAKRLLAILVPRAHIAFGPADWTLLSIENTLARTTRLSGDRRRAKELFQALKIRLDEHYGIDHPLSLAVANNLSKTTYELGEFSRSLDLYRETLEAKQRVLGSDHPSTLASRLNIAILNQDSGRMGEAAKQLRDIYHGYVSRGLRRQSIAAATHLALSLIHGGRASEARQLMDDVLPASSTFDQQATDSNRLNAQLVESEFCLMMGNFSCAESFAMEVIADDANRNRFDFIRRVSRAYVILVEIRLQHSRDAALESARNHQDYLLQYLDNDHPLVLVARLLAMALDQDTDAQTERFAALLAETREHVADTHPSLRFILSLDPDRTQ